jgi:hypothetical protein
VNIVKIVKFVSFFLHFLFKKVHLFSLVRWAGYSAKYDTWEDESNIIHAKEAIQNFEAEQHQQWEKEPVLGKKTTYACSRTYKEIEKKY